MADARGDGATPGTPEERPGVDAASPHRIPLRGWWQILRRSLGNAVGERLMVQVSAVAFFALLSIAPVLLTAVSIYGAINTPEEALQQLSDMAEVLPDDLEPLVADQLTSITAASGQVVTLRGLSGLLAALWTATTAATYLVDALTLAYREQETRGLLRRSGLGLAVVLGGAALLGAAIVGQGLLASVLAAAPGPLRALEPALVWLGLAALMVLVLAVLYRVGPDRRKARWRWISGGAVLATVLWLATTAGLFAYVQGLGDYTATYGSLAGVAISMVWLWLSVFLVVLGAVVDAEAERQTAHDSTVGPERPLGERGAVVADSAPPYPEDR
ncbi:MAG TPA: YihY/virulence factor BrkB family protein [Geodermatophilus sp.]|nr:YihY/virulence factor BrkB family protein [Geodermatophilus sp.]